MLGSEHGEALQPALRAFELLLLREVGLLPALDLQTSTLEPLRNGGRYSLVPEGGIAEAGADQERASLAGEQWIALQAAVDDPAPFGSVLRAATGMSELKPQLRHLLHYHCGVATLRTRQLLLELQSL